MIVRELLNRSEGVFVQPDALVRDADGKFWVNQNAAAFDPQDEAVPPDAVVALRYNSGYEVCPNHQFCPSLDQISPRERPVGWIGTQIAAPGSDWVKAIIRVRTNEGLPF